IWMWIVAALYAPRIIFRTILTAFGAATVETRQLSACPTAADNALNIFGGFCRCDWFDAHGEESAQEQNDCTPYLSVTEAFTEDPCGEPHCARWTKELECLGQRDADFSDCYVVQDVCEGNAAYCGNDQD